MKLQTVNPNLVLENQTASINFNRISKELGYESLDN